MRLNSRVEYRLSVYRSVNIAIRFIYKRASSLGCQTMLLPVRLVRSLRCASRIIRAARFCIRRILSSVSLFHDVHTELAYIISSFITALK